MCVYIYCMVSEKPRCEKCGSTQIYVRLTSRDMVCRTCGNIKKLDMK